METKISDPVKVGIIDYGMGNLRSVQSALEQFPLEVLVSNSPEQLLKCDRLILPGVGSFFRAMENIRSQKLDLAIKDYAASGRPLMGICLGMQLLATRGTEDGDCEGLGLVPGVVDQFQFTDLPIPHVGFNAVSFTPSAAPITSGLGEKSDFYFVHSYRMVCDSEEDVAGWCNYGENFAALVKRDNVFGAQFHPEKSQSNGLKLLNGFLKS